MKKLLFCAAVMASLAIPASAQVKKHVSRNYCPAKSCTDHSLDVAYSPEWKEAMAQQEARTISRLPKRNVPNPWQPAMSSGYYNMQNVTVYGNSMGYTRPSPYLGDDAPTYDGAAANAYRNMRANNTSEPLPPNNGNNGR